MNFQEALNKYFKFRNDPGQDNLPILATGKYKYGTPGDYGRNAIARVIGALEFTEGVEIGTFMGSSAIMWCKANPKLHLKCIDPYAPYRARPSKRVQDANYARACRKLEPYNADIIRVASMEVVDEFADGSLDFINIDGDHCFDACAMDIIRWVPKVKVGGLVVIHDYCVFERAGTMHAIDSYTSCHRIDPWYVTRDVLPTAFWQRGAERAG